MRWEPSEDRLDRYAGKLRPGGVDDVEDAVVGAAGEDHHAIVIVDHHHQLVVEGIRNQGSARIHEEPAIAARPLMGRTDLGQEIDAGCDHPHFIDILDAPREAIQEIEIETDRSFDDRQGFEEPIGSGTLAKKYQRPVIEFEKAFETATVIEVMVGYDGHPYIRDVDSQGFRIGRERRRRSHVEQDLRTVDLDVQGQAGLGTEIVPFLD